MKRIINKFKSRGTSGVFRGMITLAMGASAARIIGFISIPFLTRIYSPDDYGVLALFTSLVAVLVPFVTMKYSTAIPLPKTDKVAINIMALGLLTILFISVITGLLLFVFGEVILSWFDAAALAKLWWLIVLAMAGSGMYELFSFWSTRKKNFRFIAVSQLFQSLMGNGVKIALGLFGLQSSGLIFGQFVAQSSGVVGLLKGSLEDFKLNIAAVSLKRIRFVAYYYREFAYFRLPSQVLMVLSIQAPLLLMAALYGREHTGQLSLAIMAVSMPASLIGGSMSQAFYAEIAKLGNNNIEEIKRISIDVQKKLFMVGVPCVLVLVLLAEGAFGFVFGEKWMTAGYYASILAPYVLLQLTSAPLVQLLNIVGSQIAYLAINVIRIAGLAIVFVVFQRYSFESETLVKVMSAYLSLFYFAISVIIFHMVNRRLRS